MSPRLLTGLLCLPALLVLLSCDSVVCVGGAITPTVGAVSPATMTAGSPQFTMTVTGSDFTSASVVQFNGVSRPTVFVNSTELRATVLASDVAQPGTAQISVTVTSSNQQCSINGSNLVMFQIN